MPDEEHRRSSPSKHVLLRNLDSVVRFQRDVHELGLAKVVLFLTTAPEHLHPLHATKFSRSSRSLNGLIESQLLIGSVTSRGPGKGALLLRELRATVLEISIFLGMT